jgi:hypothetical protein
MGCGALECAGMGASWSFATRKGRNDARETAKSSLSSIEDQPCINRRVVGRPWGQFQGCRRVAR